MQQETRGTTDTGKEQGETDAIVQNHTKRETGTDGFP